MPDLSFTLYVLIGWVLLLAVIVGCVVLAGMRRTGLSDGLSGDPRIGPADRRTASGDRRVGLPDLRTLKVERRRGSSDRRGVSQDRRIPAF